MANISLSKKIIIGTFILFGGILVATVFLFPDVFSIAQMTTDQISQWVQNTDSGVLVPACFSSEPTTSCNPDGSANITVSWSAGPNEVNCFRTYIEFSSGGVTHQNPGWLECTDSYTWETAVRNTDYNFAVFYDGSGTKNVSDITTPNCSVPSSPPGNFTLSSGSPVACNSVPLSWTASANATAYRILKGSPRVDISPYQPYTALNFSDTSVSQNSDYLYQIEAYNSAGTRRSNTLNITTPYCPPSLIFSGNPTNIGEGQSSTLTWESSYTNSCTASGAWSGPKTLSGNEIVFPSPPPNVTYNLSCSGPGGITPLQSVIINIVNLPDWLEIIPR